MVKMNKIFRHRMNTGSDRVLLAFIVTNYLRILLQSHISHILDINLPSSPLNLFLIYATCFVEIKLERQFLAFWKKLLKLFWCRHLIKKCVPNF